MNTCRYCKGETTSYSDVCVICQNDLIEHRRAYGAAIDQAWIEYRENNKAIHAHYHQAYKKLLQRLANPLNLDLGTPPNWIGGSSPERSDEWETV